jgi:hypothetical protein
MAQSDEIIRLLLDMGVSKENVQAVAKELQGLRVTTIEAKQGYEVLERQIGTYTVSTAQAATAEDKAVAAALEQTRAQKALTSALADTTTATHAVSTAATGAVGTRAAGGRGLLGASYAFQDFASVLSQGGANALPRALGAVSNNLDQIAMTAGLSAAAAGGLSVAFTGLVAVLPVLIPLFEKGWKAIGGGHYSEKVPQAAEDLDRLTESIKKNKDELEELRKKQELSMMEGIKYRDLVAETTRLEEEQANARAARSVGVYDNKADRARASAFREGLGEYGGGEKLVQAMVDAGLPRKEAEARVADALKGDALQIANIGNRTPKFKHFYTSPEEAGLQKAREQVQKDIERQTAAKNKQMEHEARDRGRVERQGQAEKDKKAKELDRAQAEIDKGATAAFKEEHAANSKKVGGTDIDEQARLAAAQMRAQGGYVDRFGREQRLNPAWQERKLQAMVDFEIKRRFPEMSKDQRQAVAAETTRSAGAEVSDQIQAAQAMALREGNNATQATQQAMLGLIQKLRQEAERARMLQRNAGAMMQRNQPAANAGWP